MSAKVFTLYPKQPDPFDRTRAAFDALDAHLAAFERQITAGEALNARVLMRCAVADAQTVMGQTANRLEWLGSSLPEGSPGRDLCVETIRLLQSAHTRIAEVERQAREIEDRLSPAPGGVA